MEKIRGGENIGYSRHLDYIDRKPKQPIHVVEVMLKENIKLAANQFCYLTEFDMALKNLLSSENWDRFKSHSKRLVSNK